MDNIFDLDVLSEAPEGESVFTKLHDASAVWSKIDNVTQMTLVLPLRLKRQIKAIASVFRGICLMILQAVQVIV